MLLEVPFLDNTSAIVTTFWFPCQMLSLFDSPINVSGKRAIVFPHRAIASDQSPFFQNFAASSRTSSVDHHRQRNNSQGTCSSGHQERQTYLQYPLGLPMQHSGHHRSSLTDLISLDSLISITRTFRSPLYHTRLPVLSTALFELGSVSQ